MLGVTKRCLAQHVGEVDGLMKVGVRTMLPCISVPFAWFLEEDEV